MRARVIAATNRDLHALVKTGAFRADLYFRLGVVCLQIPPLRAREDDMNALVALGLERIAEAFGQPVAQPSEEFLARLRRHRWPGNVRELFNALEHVVVRVCPSRRQLQASDLDGVLPPIADAPDALGSPGSFPTASVGSWRCAERSAVRPDALGQSVLESVLRATGGNVSRAARRLGLPRSTLRYRIQRAQLGHLLARD